MWCGRATGTGGIRPYHWLISAQNILQYRRKNPTLNCIQAAQSQGDGASGSDDGVPWKVDTAHPAFKRLVSVVEGCLEHDVSARYTSDTLLDNLKHINTLVHAHSRGTTTTAAVPAGSRHYV